jgi:uncharacterized protein (TIGR00251 family)
VSDGAPREAGLRAVGEGVRIDVEVKLRASRTCVLGMKAERLCVAVAAPPVDGAANDALRRALAEYFGLPQKSVRIVAGEKSRRKRVELTGVSLAQVRVALAQS